MGALDSRFHAMQSAVHTLCDALGIFRSQIVFITPETFGTYTQRKPAIGIYFGKYQQPAPDCLNILLKDSIVIAPVASSLKSISAEIPEVLKEINVLAFSEDSDSPHRLASLIFETFRLLRKERGIFISYRRKGSQPLANLLYDELDKRGFDVFIDVRSVPPAVNFQAELWHRMSDVDVIVLIDTPGFREGRWTSAELTQANALGIQTLHLLWPGQEETTEFSFSRYLPLQHTHFTGGSAGRGATIRKDVLRDICDRAEQLRAGAMAVRHAHLVDNFCDEARVIGFSPVVQPQRWISLRTDKEHIAVIPAVGRPTSDRINAIFDSIAEHAADSSAMWVIYDRRGLHENWIKHLHWLDAHLPIRTLDMIEAVAALKKVRHD